MISGPRGIGKSTLMRSTQELIERPWRDIPVSVTEDRLFGTIDTEKAIYSGQKKLYPGIINEADQGVLYLDDANLLREDLITRRRSRLSEILTHRRKLKSKNRKDIIKRKRKRFS